ncbi:kelch repeat-containing protein [Massilibacteroides vaginae]|uniref:kelch repeat-containing protein n=1 Tax=Massilibacteroides vaginae TaxID=1673718 RepID=UPI001594B9EC|nr:kelch repeat-containing protein [Massilibacteroides vaginae]
MNLLLTNENQISSSKHSKVIEGIALPENSERGGHVGGMINGKPIILGGTSWNKEKTSKTILKNSLIFEDDHWTEGIPLPIPLAYSIFCHNETGLYIAGGTTDGNNMSNEVYVLKAINNKNEWDKLPNLPECIGFGSGAILNNKFYVSGGTSNEGYSDKMWVLDICQPNKGWVKCGSIPGSPRILHALVACENYLYVIGGLSEVSPLTPLSDLFRYNPEKDKWEKLKNLPFNGYGWMGQSLDANKILITGRADGMVHKGIWTIDVKSGLANNIGSLIIQSTTAPLIKISEEEWWLIGGEPDSNKTRTGKVSIIKFKK